MRVYSMINLFRPLLIDSSEVFWKILLFKPLTLGNNFILHKDSRVIIFILRKDSRVII